MPLRLRDRTSACRRGPAHDTAPMTGRPAGVIVVPAMHLARTP